MADIIRFSVKIDSFTYPDGTCALSGINFEVKAGDFAGILGANGSGKTTLLRAMDGLIKDFQGAILLDGADVRKLKPKEIYKKVGLVFQNPNDQLFAPTVFEDVAFGPLNMGFNQNEVRHRVTQALESVGMAAYAGKAIQALSFGQKKRVCMAGLLAMGHEILLLDEPTAGLDPAGEYQMLELLSGLNRKQGITIVMATHSVDIVPLFIHRLHILSCGCLVKSGLPEDVFTSPDDLSGVKLKLPQVAELIYRLKHEDRLPFGKIPLTVGEARREVLGLYA